MLDAQSHRVEQPGALEHSDVHRLMANSVVNQLMAAGSAYPACVFPGLASIKPYWACAEQHSAFNCMRA